MKGGGDWPDLRRINAGRTTRKQDLQTWSSGRASRRPASDPFTWQSVLLQNKRVRLNILHSRSAPSTSLSGAVFPNQKDESPSSLSKGQRAGRSDAIISRHADLRSFSGSNNCCVWTQSTQRLLLNSNKRGRTLRFLLENDLERVHFYKTRCVMQQLSRNTRTPQQGEEREKIFTHDSVQIRKRRQKDLESLYFNRLFTFPIYCFSTQETEKLLKMFLCRTLKTTF